MTVPTEIWALENLANKLTSLNMSRNGITTLPQELYHCVALQTLTVEENVLESVSLALNQIPKLQFLRLRKNCLTETSLQGLFVKTTALSRSLKVFLEEQMPRD